MGMQLAHSFTVPAPLERTWREFNDLEGVAGCFPGATITSVEGEEFTGTVKVKLGPIALQYSGSGTVRERDEGAHRLLIRANGKDKRGNGTAGADVIATLTEAGGSTDVEVLTDLSITGKPAQFGRGVMQDVSDKLLGQFVACLESRLAAGPADAGAVAGSAPAEPGAVTPPDNAVQTWGAQGGADPGGSAAPSAPPSDAVSSAPASTAPTSTAPTSTAPASPGAPAHAGEPLDLAATVLPVLAKTYWKQALGALLALLVLRRLLSR